MISTPNDWARDQLPFLGAPVTINNERILVAWAAVEGGHWHNLAAFNPLNTTHREPGSTSINSVGVQRYTSWAQGLHATATTLLQSNMAGVVAALRADRLPIVTAQAIGDSSWLDAHPPHPAYVQAIVSRLGTIPVPPHPPGVPMGRYQLVSTPSGNGYWVIDTERGAVFAYGDAVYHGAPNAPH